MLKKWGHLAPDHRALGPWRPRVGRQDPGAQWPGTRVPKDLMVKYFLRIGVPGEPGARAVGARVPGARWPGARCIFLEFLIFVVYFWKKV